MIELLPARLQPAVHPEGTEAETCNFPTANWSPAGSSLYRSLTSCHWKCFTGLSFPLKGGSSPHLCEQVRLYKRKPLVNVISNDSESFCSSHSWQIHAYRIRSWFTALCFNAQKKKKMMLHFYWLQTSVVDYQTKKLTPPRSKERPNSKPCASCSEVKDNSQLPFRWCELCG